MPAAKPIQIIGGGLAGLTLGIALRKERIPVTIFEAGKYPRHRVCGEFISGRGLEVLETFELKQKLLAAGAIQAQSAAFFSENFQSPVHSLPAPALCLSRFTMDMLLADEFQKLGGELRADERWKGGDGEGIVRASGRRLKTVENGWRWFGMKAHAKNVPLEADLEMHLSKNSYIGLCKLTDGEVNICGLFRRNENGNLPGNGFDLLRGTPGTFLHERLAAAKFDEDSCCSVAGLSLRPDRASDKSEVCIGDTLTMIPPVTGNGMSLAFESARLATGPLADFSRGNLPWSKTREQIACACDETFSRRLRWANWLQRLMFSPVVRSPFGRILFQSEAFWKMMFAKTR
ncbi:MAG TPA: FAD-dependent monooxygenase [Verrucomicrobiae bacterium]|jgi:flavin-dependent dehydrogenase